MPRGKPRKNRRQRHDGMMPTQLEKLERIVMVSKLMAEGFSRDEALVWCQRTVTPEEATTLKMPAKAWTVARGTARSYVSHGWKAYLVQHQQSTVEVDAANNLAKTDRVYALAIAKGELGVALRAISLRALLDGSLAADRVRAPQSTIDIDAAEAVKMIDHAAETVALMRRRGALAAPVPEEKEPDEPEAQDAELVEGDDDGLNDPAVAAAAGRVN